MTGEIGKLSADQEEQGDRFALLTGLLPAAIWNVKLSLTDLFFFQAEDGIRDYKVTGVQTLCSSDLSWARRWQASRRFWPRRTSRKSSTDIAARNRAACRCRQCRPRFWCRRLRSRRRPSPTTGRRCFPNRRTWSRRAWGNEDPAGRGGGGGSDGRGDCAGAGGGPGDCG